MPYGRLRWRKAYHTEQAARAVQQKQWFAAEFHLGRVLRDDPENTVKTRLARVASEQKKFALTTRLWTEAMASNPKLGDDSKTQPRYHAARAACLAAAGRGEDEPPAGDAMKMDLHRQALSWLKADMDFWTKQLESTTPESRSAIVQALQSWQKDPDLAGIRETAALGRTRSG